MSEYWKSQPRKFCEFCKCWITDNKPSRDFHEKGKNHQANVKKKIEDVKQKSYENAKKQKEDDSFMEQMERAALEAFKKDLEADPELAKQYGVRLKFEGPEYKPPDYEEEKKESDDEPPEEKSTGEWYEALSPEGYHYYWNTITNESVWVKPEKYVSLDEQEAESDNDKEVDGDKETNNKIEKEENSQPEMTPEDIKNIPFPEPAPVEDRNARAAYGGWERVSYVTKPEIDLQLPNVPVENIPLPDIPTEEEPKFKFKEKRVESLAGNSQAPVAFKKRKLASGARNVRSRGDDD